MNIWWQMTLPVAMIGGRGPARNPRRIQNVNNHLVPPDFSSPRRSYHPLESCRLYLHSHPTSSRSPPPLINSIAKMPDVPVSPAAPGASASSTKTFTIQDLKENGTREKFYMLLHDKGESCGPCFVVEEMVRGDSETRGGDVAMTDGYAGSGKGQMSMGSCGSTIVFRCGCARGDCNVDDGRSVRCGC
jgi:hypothetical protein